MKLKNVTPKQIKKQIDYYIRGKSEWPKQGELQKTTTKYKVRTKKINKKWTK